MGFLEGFAANMWFGLCDGVIDWPWGFRVSVVDISHVKKGRFFVFIFLIEGSLS